MIPHLSLVEPGRSWRHFKKARRSRRNPSELAWDRLIAAGVPFVKVGLFRVNHYGLSLPADRDSLRVVGTYDAGLIDAHIARLAAAAA
jgi:hypothetical protein